MRGLPPEGKADAQELGAGRCGLANERGNFFEAQADDEHWMRRDAAPAHQVPMRADEIDFGPRGEIENLARIAAIETLRYFQDGLLAEVLPIGRAPDGHVNGFLFNLIRNLKRAEKCTRLAAANINRLSVPVRSDARSRRNQIECCCH
jgi:hypothetical protein